MKVEKEFRRMQQQHKRENVSVQKLSNRKFMINTSFQIIARRVKEPTQVHKKQKMSHNLSKTTSGCFRKN